MQYNDFGITQSILTGELNEYQNQAIIQTQTAILGNSIAEPTDYVNSLVESTGSAQNFTILFLYNSQYNYIFYAHSCYYGSYRFF